MVPYLQMECISKVKADLKNKIIYYLIQFLTPVYIFCKWVTGILETLTRRKQVWHHHCSPLSKGDKMYFLPFASLPRPGLERYQLSFWSTVSSPGDSKHSEYLKTNPSSPVIVISCSRGTHLPFLKAFSVQCPPALQLPPPWVRHTATCIQPSFPTFLGPTDSLLWFLSSTATFWTSSLHRTTHSMFTLTSGQSLLSCLWMFASLFSWLNPSQHFLSFFF